MLLLLLLLASLVFVFEAFITSAHIKGADSGGPAEAGGRVTFTVFSRPHKPLPSHAVRIHKVGFM